MEYLVIYKKYIYKLLRLEYIIFGIFSSCFCTKYLATEELFFSHGLEKCMTEI